MYFQHSIISPWDLEPDLKEFYGKELNGTKLLSFH